MKPFFEAGLTLTSGCTAISISNCSLFKRTYHFLLEVWESLYRFMLSQFLKYRNDSEYNNDITQAVEDTYLKLTMQ